MNQSHSFPLQIIDEKGFRIEGNGNIPKVFDWLSPYVLDPIFVWGEESQNFGISYCFELARLWQSNLRMIPNEIIDLKKMLIDIHVKVPSNHFSFYDLLERNKLLSADIIPGHEEYGAFDFEGNRSTEAKTKAIYKIIQKVLSKSLVVKR